MSLIFRKATPAERDGVERVLRSSFTPYIRRLGREIGGAHFDFLEASIERGDTYVAVDGETIVGVASTEARDGGLYLDHLGIAPERQGSGLGSWLLVRVEEVARSAGASSLSLDTAEMAEANIRLYRRHGFEIVSRAPPPHGKDLHLRAHMVKPLSSPALGFRKAIPAECDGVVRILLTSFTPYFRRLGREITAANYDTVGASIEQGDIYVAVDGETIVGVAVTEGRDDGLYLARLGVAPARQGTGVGSWVLARLAEIARSAGARQMSLNTAEMAEANIRLYQRHGFEIVSRAPPTHGKDPHMRVHMVKSL